MLPKGISVIICCHNSESRILPTLMHLSKQKDTASFQWEIVLVNNSSTDDTETVANEIWLATGNTTDFRIIREPTTGLSNARAKGVMEARYEYIVFCDDDNWLNPDYIGLAYETLDVNQEIGVVGGHGEAITDGGLPEWFHQERFSYATGTHFDHSKDITDERTAWGAGLVSRKSLLLKVFNPSTPLICAGRNENGLSSGDDDEICLRIILMGYRVYFHYGLTFKHYIAPHRLTREYYQKMWDGFSKPQNIMNKYRLLIKLNKMNIFKKTALVIYNGIKLCYGKIFNKKEPVSYALVYLFFLTRIQKVADRYTNAIWSFYKLNAKNSNNQY